MLSDVQTFQQLGGSKSEVAKETLRTRRGSAALMRYAEACAKVVNLFDKADIDISKSEAEHRAFADAGNKKTPWLHLNTEDFLEQLKQMGQRAVKFDLLSSGTGITNRVSRQQDRMDNFAKQWREATWQMREAHQQLVVIREEMQSKKSRA